MSALSSSIGNHKSEHSEHLAPLAQMSSLSSSIGKAKSSHVVIDVEAMEQTIEDFDRIAKNRRSSPQKRLISSPRANSSSPRRAQGSSPRTKTSFLGTSPRTQMTSPRTQMTSPGTEMTDRVSLSRTAKYPTDEYSPMSLPLDVSLPPTVHHDNKKKKPHNSSKSPRKKKANKALSPSSSRRRPGKPSLMDTSSDEDLFDFESSEDGLSLKKSGSADSSTKEVRLRQLESILTGLHQHNSSGSNFNDIKE